MAATLSGFQFPIDYPTRPMFAGGAPAVADELSWASKHQADKQQILARTQATRAAYAKLPVVRPSINSDAIQPRRTSAYDGVWQGRAPAVKDAAAIVLTSRPLFAHQAEQEAEIRLDQADMPPERLSRRMGIDKRRLLPAHPAPPVDYSTPLMQRVFPVDSDWRLDARDQHIVDMSMWPSVANVQNVVLLPGAVEQKSQVEHYMNQVAKHGATGVLQRRYAGFHSDFNMQRDGIDAQLVFPSERRQGGALHVMSRAVIA